MQHLFLFFQLKNKKKKKQYKNGMGRETVCNIFYLQDKTEKKKNKSKL